MLYRGKHFLNLDRITEYPDRSFMVLASLSRTRNSGSIPSSRKAFYFIQVVQNIMGVRPVSCLMCTGGFYRAVKQLQTENDRSPTSGADTKNV
jgi:hypothetical protein